jgi:hypothetical protein
MAAAARDLADHQSRRHANRMTEGFRVWLGGIRELSIGRQAWTLIIAPLAMAVGAASPHLAPHQSRRHTSRMTEGFRVWLGGIRELRIGRQAWTLIIAPLAMAVGAAVALVIQ